MLILNGTPVMLSVCLACCKGGYRVQVFLASREVTADGASHFSHFTSSVVRR